MRFAIIFCLSCVVFLATWLALYLAIPHTYPPLVGVRKLIISDSAGHSYEVHDQKTIRPFVKLANDYRYDWKVVPIEQGVPTFSIAFESTSNHAEQAFEISNEFNYRYDSSIRYVHVRYSDARSIALQFLALIHGVTGADRNFRCLTYYQDQCE